MKALLPLWHLAQRLYYDWALREIDPSHPDVPRIVLARARLPKPGERGAISWWTVCALALVAWAMAVSCDVRPLATAGQPAAVLPALGPIELSQVEHQARVLCARHRTTTGPIALADGALVCDGQHRQHSVITTYHRQENTPWNGPTSY